MQYFDQINKAERLICQEKYKEANKIYLNEIKKKNGLLSQDLRNAFITALNAHDKKAALTFWHNINQRPFLSGKILTNTKIMELSESVLPGQIKSEIPETNGITIQEKSFNDFIDSLLVIDQALRSYCRGYAKSCRDSVRREDQRNFPLLKVQFKEKIDVLRELYCAEAFNEKIFTMVLHNKAYSDTSLDGLYLKLLQQQKIKPVSYAHLIDYRNDDEVTFSKNKEYGTMMVYQILNDTILHFKASAKHIDEYNKNRKEIGMDEVDTDKPKLEFLLKHPVYHIEDFNIESFRMTMPPSAVRGFIDEQLKSGQLIK